MPSIRAVQLPRLPRTTSHSCELGTGVLPGGGIAVLPGGGITILPGGGIAMLPYKDAGEGVYIGTATGVCLLGDPMYRRGLVA